MKALLIVLIAAILAVSGCVSEMSGNSTAAGNQTHSARPAQPIILSDGMTLAKDQCASRGIEDMVVVFYETGCPACEQAVPVLREIEKDIPGKGFRFLNLMNDRESVEELGLVPSYVPTVVINCRVYVGVRAKEQYLSYIRGG